MLGKWGYDAAATGAFCCAVIVLSMLIAGNWRANEQLRESQNQGAAAAGARAAMAGIPADANPYTGSNLHIDQSIAWLNGYMSKSAEMKED